MTPATGADQIMVDANGFDFHWYEASYPNSFSPSPTIVGLAGTSDLTMSSLGAYESDSSTAKHRIRITRRIMMERRIRR